MLSQLGEGAKLLAGGQSLIPLLKLRFASPEHLVDVSFVREGAYIRSANGSLHFGALTRHCEIESSPLVAAIPMLHDCAAGIADVQIRNRGTIGGSLAEADPSGDWANALFALDAQVRCVGPNAQRSVPLRDFIQDAYTTALAHDEVVAEVVVKSPPKGSGGAYLAFKRAAPVYPTASVAVQLTMEDGVCRDAAISLGCVGLIPIRVPQAEDALRGGAVDGKAMAAAAEAARLAADPQDDTRGSAAYKRALVAGLVRRALEIAVLRAVGKDVEVAHLYA